MRIGRYFSIRHLSYRRKLMLHTMIASVIPIIILCALYMAFSMKQVARDIQRTMTNNTDKMGSVINDEMDNMIRLMRNILADSRIWDALTATHGRAKGEEILDYQYMKSKLTQYQNYNKVDRIRILFGFDTVYTDDNINFFSMDAWKPEEQTEASGWNGTALFHFPYRGDEYLFSYFQSVYSYKDNRIASVVLVDQTAESIFSKIRDAGAYIDNSEAFMIDAGMSVVAAADRAVIGRKLYDLYDIKRRQLHTGFYSEDAYLVSVSGMIKSEFYLVQIASREVLNAQVGNVLLITALVCLLAIAISFLISMQAARNLTSRLLRLTKAIDSHVECSEVKPDETEDEVTIVINAYNRMLEDERQLQKEVFESRLQEERAKLAALQAQINPHFLYNILAGIKSVIDLNRQAEASVMISDLSRFFQLVLSRGDEKISICDEAEMVGKYIMLLSMVYRGQFTWQIDIDENIKPFLITKFTLQPLVENAIRHGIRQKRTPGVLKITGGFDADDIVIRVIDDGVGIDFARLATLKKNLDANSSAKKTGYGLCNVDARLKLHYGNKYGLQIESVKGAGTTISIRIPQDV